MKNDIETGLKYFDRVCVNIMNKNTTKVLPDDKVIDVFVKKIAPIIGGLVLIGIGISIVVEHLL